ncbi:unnamed protein product [Lactuca virosa]|uniref:Uncharacterized protein n=1 Tax=Lactuca virosa TaxID=75947 RepID=A0AAU9NYZ5_9ASTR|nr:unnamed protein product [Lactuca virosa]
MRMNRVSWPFCCENHVKRQQLKKTQKSASYSVFCIKKKYYETDMFHILTYQGPCACRNLEDNHFTASELYTRHRRKDVEFGGSFHKGRGEHLKVKRQIGMLKSRIRPCDITINIGNACMIGDNPSDDARHPCFSILTRIGVFRGRENCSDYHVYRGR